MNRIAVRARLVRHHPDLKIRDKVSNVMIAFASRQLALRFPAHLDDVDWATGSRASESRYSTRRKMSAEPFSKHIGKVVHESVLGMVVHA